MGKKQVPELNCPRTTAPASPAQGSNEGVKQGGRGVGEAGGEEGSGVRAIVSLALEFSSTKGAEAPAPC